MSKVKGIGKIAALCGAAIAIITMIAFIIYGVTYDYFDTGVVILLILAAACGVAYALVDAKWSKMLNLLAVLLVGMAMGVFFLNSYYVWADRLNNIEMYGSRGTLVPVIAIIVMCVLSAVAFIVSCFKEKEVQA